MIVDETLYTWGDFKARLPELHSGPRVLFSRFLFRGQAHVDWSLSSGFDRCFVGDDNDRQRRYEQFLRFFRHLNRRLGLDLPQDPVEAGAMAQHYGMPTRLLDWSLSPYTAAFFAFYYAKVERVNATHVAVWGLEAVRFRKEIDPRYFEIVTPKVVANPRMHRQSGKFILAKAELYDLKDHIDQRFGRDTILYRYQIPMSEADLALNDLILMGITPADIYPDFEGVAKYVRLRMAFEGFRL